eukprot:7321064-Alexandrium_andersonii.AAC.1
MSASLVGSEMCIRDSGQRGQRAPAERTGRASSFPTPAAEPGSSHITYTCLLYTSDAADDM